VLPFSVIVRGTSDVSALDKCGYSLVLVTEWLVVVVPSDSMEIVEISSERTPTYPSSVTYSSVGDSIRMTVAKSFVCVLTVIVSVYGFVLCKGISWRVISASSNLNPSRSNGSLGICDGFSRLVSS
jgi:hypothetical protein